MLDSVNFFGMIQYQYSLWLPLSHKFSHTTPEGIDIYTVDAFRIFQGWEFNHSYKGSYCTWVPYEWDKEDEPRITGFTTTKLFVATYQPTGPEHKVDWCCRPKLTRITYASDFSAERAAGQVRRQLKRSMMKTMGVKP